MHPHENAPATLQALCHSAAAGDEDAVQQLLCLHDGRLRGFLLRKIGPDWKGKIDPDDVLQEAFIDVYAGINKFIYHDDESFYRWASRIVDHRFIDHARRLRRKKRDASRESAPASESRFAFFLDQHLQDSLTASRILRREEAVGAVLACLARLPEDYRDVIRRLFLDETPIARLAVDMNRTEDAVRRLAGRALDKLRAHLTDASRYLSPRD